MPKSTPSPYAPCENSHYCPECIDAASANPKYTLALSTIVAGRRQWIHRLIDVEDNQGNRNATVAYITGSARRPEAPDEENNFVPFGAN